MNNLAMSELLLNEIIFSQTRKVNFSINSEMRLIECNDSKVKNILDLLLKSGKLSAVKMQILDFLHNDTCHKDILGRLKFLVDNKQIDFIIKETKSGVDFAWEIIRNPE